MTKITIPSHLRLIPLENNQHYYCDIGGNIYSTKLGSLYKLKQSKLTTYGYHQVSVYINLKNSVHLSHRLIALTWIPTVEGKPHINHKNGVKTDNHINNLEWCTTAYNTRHAVEIGTLNNKGENHGLSKLSESDVLDVRERLSSGESRSSIARLYNVSYSAINSIKIGRTWGHL